MLSSGKRRMVLTVPPDKPAISGATAFLDTKEEAAVDDDEVLRSEADDEEELLDADIVCGLWELESQKSVAFLDAAELKMLCQLWILGWLPSRCKKKAVAEREVVRL